MIDLHSRSENMLDWYNIWPYHLSWFSWTKLPYLYFIYKKYGEVKKNICWRITFAAISLTTNHTPPPFRGEKNSSKLKDFQIYDVIKVEEYLNIGIHLVRIEESNIFIFFTFEFQKKVSVYHSGSVFTQHHYVCRVSFVFNTPY